jgi:uncharacterized spore protein YtfJ
MHKSGYKTWHTIYEKIVKLYPNKLKIKKEFKTKNNKWKSKDKNQNKK